MQVLRDQIMKFSASLELSKNKWKENQLFVPIWSSYYLFKGSKHLGQAKVNHARVTNLISSFS